MDKGEQVAQEQVKLQPEVIFLTYKQLVNAYNENEVAADIRFKNKIVQVSGKIESISKDIAGETFINLGSGNDYEFNSVLCHFDNTSSLINLKKGQMIRILGLVDGFSMDSVTLLSCQIIE